MVGHLQAGNQENEMQSRELYDRLERDFIKGHSDTNWSKDLLAVPSVAPFITPSYAQRNMGLVCDFAPGIITRAFTAVFASDAVVRSIVTRPDAPTDAVLLVHHPMSWDITKPACFEPMSAESFEALRSRRISLFNLHVPLDDCVPHSTSVTLANAVGVKGEGAFAPYFSCLAGLIGTVAKGTTLTQLRENFEAAVGHRVSLITNGGPGTIETKVAVIGGGGNSVEFLEDAIRHEAKVLVTGITRVSPYSQKAHEFAAANHVSILGGTHYSTEKFSMLSMAAEYFGKTLGIPATFIPEEPMLEDL